MRIRVRVYAYYGCIGRKPSCLRASMYERAFLDTWMQRGAGSYLALILTAAHVVQPNLCSPCTYEAYGIQAALVRVQLSTKASFVTVCTATMATSTCTFAAIVTLSPRRASAHTQNCRLRNIYARLFANLYMYMYAYYR